MDGELEAIRRTVRIFVALTGAAFTLTYLLADWVGFDRPVQAALIVLLTCLALIAMAILAIVVAQRFFETIDTDEPYSAPRTLSAPRARGVFANPLRSADGGLDGYLRRIYREVAPGDRSYVRKSGGLGPARSKYEPRTPASSVAADDSRRNAAPLRTEPYRPGTTFHPKPHREPRS